MKGTLARSALLVVALTVLGVGGWELYIRKVKGAEIAFDDGPPLWVHKRCMVYEPSDQSTVFIGSSRIKYDLDIATWERITGDHAIQLATEGASPRPVLYDLAADENFRGKLIIDVTEVLFFGEGPLNVLVDASINYHKDLTPAQRASFVINKPLESTMAFLDKDNYSLNAMLDKLRIPSRAGVFMMPIFPMEFGRTSFERQAYMTPKFLVDTTLQNQVRAIWAFLQKSNQLPPVSGDTLRQVIVSVKEATDKIKARGGQVLFVRTPSSGPFWAGEQMGFPREKYWNAVLETTGCKGIHFADYPATANFVCPEFSHLTPQDAVIYTEQLVRILNEEMGWAFPKLPAK